MDLYYKATVWVIFEKIKFFFFACLYGLIYYNAIVWVIFWRKLNFFFCVSVWTYAIRLQYGSYFGEN
jgi:hypothetical protein